MIGLHSFHIEGETFLGVVIEAKENYYLFASLKGKYYVYEKSNQKEEGDILTIRGKTNKIAFVTLESQFNFQTYLQKKGYRYEIKVECEKKHFLQPFRKKKWLNRLEKNLDKNSYIIVKKLFFNFGTKENSSMIEMYEDLNLYTLLSIGTYVYTFILKRLEKKKTFFSFLFLSPFFFLRPTRLFFKRFFLSFILEKYISWAKVQVSSIQKVAKEAMIILLLNPFYALQMEYIITYSILFSLHLISPLLYDKSRRKKKIIQWALIQGVFMAFQGYSSYMINLSTPIISIISPLFYFLQLCILLSSYLSFYSLTVILIAQYQRLGKILSTFSFFINVGDCSFIIVALFLFFVFYAFIKAAQKERKNATIVIIILSFSFIIKAFPLSIKENQISFINVGQGDAILLENDGINVLVDTGGLSYMNVAEDVLIPYFKKKKIQKIHHLIITHNDFDHCGAKEDLIKKGWIAKVDALEENFPLQFSSFTISNLNIWRMESMNENDRSFVLSIVAHQCKILLMGDASKEIENKMLHTYPILKHDILKLGHHGSNTSSSFSFLQVVNPKVAVISCGKNNYYGHPSKETIQNLMNLNIPYYRTDEKGTITFSIGKTYSFFFAYRYLWYTYKRNKEYLYAIPSIWSPGDDS